MSADFPYTMHVAYQKFEHELTLANILGKNDDRVRYELVPLSSGKTGYKYHTENIDRINSAGSLHYM